MAESSIKPAFEPSFVCLAAASLLFWLAWLLMPGVGITDTQTIFALVGQHRPQVMLSVGVQLLSAALYVLGVVGLLASARCVTSRALRWGCGLLAVGALGSAADAIFHLVAYEMTAPGIRREAMVPVMQMLQGPDLKLLAPMILSFFAAHVVIAWSARAHGPGKASWLMVLSVPLVVVLGNLARRADLLSGRSLGLTALALVSFSLPLAVLALPQPSAPVGLPKASGRELLSR